MRCVVHTKPDEPADQVIVSQYYQWVTFVFAIQVRFTTRPTIIISHRFTPGRSLLSALQGLVLSGGRAHGLLRDGREEQDHGVQGLRAGGEQSGPGGDL